MADKLVEMRILKMKEKEGMMELHWRQGLRAEAMAKRVISSSETKSKEEQT